MSGNTQEQPKVDGKQEFLYIRAMHALTRLEEVFGSQAELARTLNISRMAVNKWRRRIPAERVLDIYRVTNGEITPHEMRPDIYPDPDWRP